GLEVGSYHIFNLAMHVLAGLALLGVVRRTLLLERWGEERHRAAPWLALAVAALWVVHPLQTAAVSYIIQRAEVLAGLFYLLTLYCVIRGSIGSPLGWYSAAVLSCALGMGSKEVMITAPVVILLYDWLFLANSLLEIIRRRWHLYLGLAATT